MKKFLCIILALISSLSVFTMTACDCGKDDDKSPSSGGGKTEIEVEDKNDTYPTLIVGAKELNLTISDYYVIKYVLKDSDEAVTFKSNNTNVATVDNDGKILAIGVGSALVSVKAGGTMKNIVVNVEASPTYSIMNFDGDVELSIGKKYTLSPLLYKGNNEVEATFTFKSNDNLIATVDEKGEINALSTGKTTILVSTVKDGKTYQTTINIICHEDCFIEASDLEIFYRTETEIPYVVKKVNGEVIPNAVATIVPSSGYNVNGNKITTLDFGRIAVTLDYFGIKKTIYVTSIYKLEKNEFNYFGHDITISGSLACDMYYFKQSAEMTTMGIVNEVDGLTSEKGNYLKVTSKLPSGKSERYVGIYLNSRQTKDKLQALYNEGLRTIRLEMKFESVSEAKIFLTFKWAANKNRNIMPSEFGSWVTVDLPLNEYILNFDNLNNITDATIAKNYQFIQTTQEDVNNYYTLYIKPITII